jgi:hypothetical protein
MAQLELPSLQTKKSQKDRNGHHIPWLIGYQPKLEMSLLCTGFSLQLDD